MITKGIWNEFDFKVNAKDYNHNFYYDSDYIALLLIIYIFCTPFVIIIDLLFMPVEIIYLICYKIIDKKRYGSDKE